MRTPAVPAHAHRPDIHAAALAGLAASLAVLAAWLLAPAAALASGAATSPTPPPSLLDLVTGWSFDLTVQVPVMASALAFVWAVRRVNARHPASPVPAARTITFLAGLAVVEYALQGPPDAWSEVLFSVHMIQHLLLMIVAAPLLVASAPVTLALRVASPRARTQWILPILHSRLVRMLTNPLIASALFAGILWVTHFTVIYELTLQDGLLHDAEHLAFLAAGLLFWWPMLGRDPSPWRVSHPVRLVAMLFEMSQGAFLGIAIMNAGAPLYAYYANIHLGWISTMADQQLAGAIMWGGGGVGFLIAGLVVFYDWMGAEEQAAARIDARLDREARERLGGAIDPAASDRATIDPAATDPVANGQAAIDPVAGAVTGPGKPGEGEPAGLRTGG